jgi:transposase
VFATDDVTLYVIDYRRSAGLVLDILGEDFEGTVLSDGLPALNALDEKGIDRAQCNGHIIRRCREMALVQTQGAVRFPRDLKQLLQDALELGRVRHSLPAATYDAAVGEVRQALSGLVSQNFTHQDNLRLAKHVFRHQDALLKFLENEAIPPTNNISERELRGAVVARKIGGCHRAEPNAHAHAVLASLAQTAHRRGETLDHHVARWMYATAGPPN